MYAVVLLALLPAFEDKNEVKPEATGRWSYAKADTNAKNDAVQLAITSEAALDKATGKKGSAAELAKALKVKAIDWDKQMLVVVTAGTMPTGGWSVEVTGLKAKDKTLTVSWKAKKPEGFATQAFTHPGTVILVPKYDKVEFAPAAKKNEK